MRALSSPLRKQLETAVLAARRVSESASRAALDGLDVFADRRPDHLGAGKAALRNGLRAKWRQLGNDRELLVAECAYEQWHRLLFARFLAENNLLLHPKFRAPVTLAECEEYAGDLGEPDGWSVAARFAAEILPGIFRVDDPCVRLRLAPEGRHALEQILDGLPAEVFAADDALDWVYQFWQKDKKDEVNNSGHKIGGADLGPVTQLFTENYMVRFLLENSLGAWWAARHPDSPLVKGFEYLRFGGDGRPAARSFDGWPDRVADVTVMDPCCGSGHFLVEAFSMLWQMRAEEEGLGRLDALDAALRDNVFGLELDPRCVQIAMLAIALQAWKIGDGWRHLPVPNIACSGIPVKASVEEWKALAGGDQRLQNALVRLHVLFRDADTLGSLIDPRQATEISDPTVLQRSIDDVDWHEIAPMLQEILEREVRDPAASVLGADATATARAALYLSRSYTLVATNVPYLSRSKQSQPLLRVGTSQYRLGAPDLATMMLERCLALACARGSIALVTPQNWQMQESYGPLRERLLAAARWVLCARLGNNAWQARFSGRVPFKLHTILVALGNEPASDGTFFAVDVGDNSSPAEKAGRLLRTELLLLSQAAQTKNADCRIVFGERNIDLPRLSDFCHSFQGLKTGDDARFRRFFWEVLCVEEPWEFLRSSHVGTRPFGGCESIVRWEMGAGELARSEGARVVGSGAWGKRGVLVGQMGNLPSSLYLGELFDSNASPIVPHDPNLLPALWAYCSRPEYSAAVRMLDSSVGVKNRSLTAVVGRHRV